ncbi:MAG: hypothetical protein V4615_17100 [Bacteroidota bacterium]
MSANNFNESIRQVAETVKQNTRCPQHGIAPDYTLIRTMKGFNVQWSCCCDIQKQTVDKNFAEEIAKHPSSDS